MGNLFVMGKAIWNANFGFFLIVTKQCGQKESNHFDYARHTDSAFAIGSICKRLDYSICLYYFSKNSENFWQAKEYTRTTEREGSRILG